MKFTITKEAFLDVLQQVQHVVSSRATLPILSNVLIEAASGSIRLTATDLDVGVSAVISADVQQDGATTLPVKRLASIVRELPASEVSVEVGSDNQASIKSGPSFFKIIGLGEEEFPPLPTFDDGKEYKIPQALLLNALKKTSYAISNDETRYVLNGVYVSFKEGKVTFVATDGRRLAMVENDLEYPASNEADIIVPAKAVAELQRMLSDDGDVHVQLSGSQISFEIDGSLIVSKLIEGNYPNYKQVIPGQRKERLSISREDFLNTIRRVSLLTSESSNSVKLSFSQGSVDVQANSKEIGNAEESIPADYNGEEFSIAFNPTFLMAPLKNLNEETIYLDLIDSMSPGVVRIDESFLYVIMPMRVTQQK
ncbi:DNA polymerase III subunit beta [Persicirhabdus sediminis]|uniref:Beta sliding clamp n=1 Tax=Persicirhabdus sediminis TaxID=454144 RepID=A0A8J7MDI7_9BACT|nr:DNA polymerase III subunit beta [Persicirhabdus sediminis]MBK1790642.1 DNA polymerase III subunit beta [Persicirhabdus sediminis]